MKKITLLFLFICSITFAQKTVSINTINGQSVNDFKIATNGTLNVGTSYTFVIDFTNQSTTANNLIVKVLTSGFADTANVISTPITTASGQLTLILTPTVTVPAAHIQVRTTTTTDFGASSVENVFLFTWKVDPSTLSTKTFINNNVAIYPNPAQDIITFGSQVITKTYKVLNLNGAVIKETAATGTLNVSDLANGTYIIMTDMGSAKLLKN